MKNTIQFLDKKTAEHYQDVLMEVRVILSEMDTEGMSKDQLLSMMQLTKRVPSLFNLELPLAAHYTATKPKPFNYEYTRTTTTTTSRIL